MFNLDSGVVAKYSKLPTSFGFNGLGELVYLRSYSRDMANGDKEQWHNTVERVVNGTFRLQKEWIVKSKLPWDENKAQFEAAEMFDRMFHMKFLPPGRGLWAMGSQLTEHKDKKMYAALNNCAFVSTERSGNLEASKPFCFLMDASMLGVGKSVLLFPLQVYRLLLVFVAFIGVGFDTKGANSIYIREPTKHSHDPIPIFVIPDSREGWVESVRLLLNCFLAYYPDLDPINVPLPQFDYSLIRPAGRPIKGNSLFKFMYLYSCILV